MSDVEIRPTLPGDLDALADVLLQVHAIDGYPVEGVDDARAWVELPQALGQWTALVSGEPVGHAALVQPSIDDGAPTMLYQQRDIDMDQIAVLVRLFVAPKARGRALARALLDAAETKARADGLTLALDVMTKDNAAIRLYESRGWRRLGTFHHTVANGLQEPALAYALVHRTAT